MFINTRRMMYRSFRPPIHLIFAAITILLLGFIAYESLVAVSARPSVQHLDKLVHFGAYFGLGCVALPALPRIAPLLVCLGLGLFGGSIEIAQGTMGIGRSADILDGLANISGAFAAILAWTTLSLLTRARAPISQ